MDENRIKRPDVILRRQNNKLINFSVIKTTWKAFCKEETFLSFPIESILKNVNKATYEAYKLANLYVIQMLSQNKMPILNKKFFYNCLTGVSKNYDKKTKKIDNDELLESINIYNSFKPHNYKPADSSYLSTYFDDVADEMVTNCNNNFEANFYNNFKRYIQIRNLWNKKETYWFLKDVYDQKYKGYDPKVWKYKELLNYEYPKNENVLLLSYNILKFFEARGEKVFTLIPNRTNFTTNYIKISNCSLYKTLKKIGLLPNNTTQKQFMDVKNEYWRKLFNIDKYETCNRRFHYVFF